MDLLFRLVLRKGRLHTPNRQIDGLTYSREDIVRLSKLTNREIPHGEYIAAKVHPNLFHLTSCRLDLRPPSLILYNKKNTHAFGLYVPKDYMKYYNRGIYFGYPKCCITAFAREGQCRDIGWWSGTGYVPCPKCALEPQESVMSGIASRRKAVTPFPIHDVTSPAYRIHLYEQACLGNLNPDTYCR